MATYRLISSDSHIVEPAELWSTRMDRKFRDRAPRLVREGDCDQWYADGVKFGNVGTNQQAGLRFEAPERLTAEGSMDTVRRGGYDRMPMWRTWTSIACQAGSCTRRRV